MLMPIVQQCPTPSLQSKRSPGDLPMSVADDGRAARDAELKFCCDLPRHRSVRRGSPIEAEVARVLAPMTVPGSPGVPVTHRPLILVVDDDAALVRGYERLLVTHGYEVDTALDGETAIRLIREKQFDVVLTDINMPGTTGVEVLKSVQAYDRDLPVVLMTGYPGLESAQAAVEYGALKYLVKPIPTTDLLEVVATLLGEREEARRRRQ